jgi:hypothetical protein
MAFAATASKRGAFADMILPARILNHDKALLGISPDSVTVDNALV